jgi:hypothetical protein
VSAYPKREEKKTGGLFSLLFLGETDHSISELGKPVTNRRESERGPFRRRKDLRRVIEIPISVVNLRE